MDITLAATIPSFADALVCTTNTANGAAGDGAEAVAAVSRRGVRNDAAAASAVRCGFDPAAFGRRSALSYRVVATDAVRASAPPSQTTNSAAGSGAGAQTAAPHALRGRRAQYRRDGRGSCAWPRPSTPRRVSANEQKPHETDSSPVSRILYQRISATTPAAELPRPDGFHDSLRARPRHLVKAPLWRASNPRPGIVLPETRPLEGSRSLLTLPSKPFNGLTLRVS